MPPIPLDALPFQLFKPSFAEAQAYQHHSQQEEKSATPLLFSHIFTLGIYHCHPRQKIPEIGFFSPVLIEAMATSVPAESGQEEGNERALPLHHAPTHFSNHRQ